MITILLQTLKLIAHEIGWLRKQKKNRCEEREKNRKTPIRLSAAVEEMCVQILYRKDTVDLEGQTDLQNIWLENHFFFFV